MKLELSAPQLMLSKGQVVAIPAAEGACVTSEDGVVWITQDGDPRDIVLQAGETACLERATPTLVQAVAPARIRIAERRLPVRGWTAFVRRVRAALGLRGATAAWA
ncbi:MAG TPA: DUF2917 domain-containing protein [Caldimonas sp.]|nr:DUF2917 domain-containing protein [Caldimonas sp.]